ncbi:MAG: cytochrome c oxidase assembly protein [Burkholderiales bacterium]|nr:cytochrome c oxidase assembly protein [Burkholderiales bacterium]
MTNESVRRSNRTMMTRLCVIAVAMFGFGFLLVPFYEKICEVTGLRNIARPDVVANTQVDATRTVRIELDSNLRNLPWTFKPLETMIDVHPGEVRQVEYEVVNTTDRPVTGQAVPSYGPQYAGQYFKKLDCFCFAKQTLQPGEVRRMPVVFVVDPKAPAELVTITLSYTFFEVAGAAQKTSGGVAPAQPDRLVNGES